LNWNIGARSKKKQVSFGRLPRVFSEERSYRRNGVFGGTGCDGGTGCTGAGGGIGVPGTVNVPGGGAPPGKVGSVAGRPGVVPGKPGVVPGKAGVTPGNVGFVPSRPGGVTGICGCTPGSVGVVPGNVGNTPGVPGGTTPVSGGKTPVLGGRTPVAGGVPGTNGAFGLSGLNRGVPFGKKPRAPFVKPGVRLNPAERFVKKMLLFVLLKMFVRPKFVGPGGAKSGLSVKGCCAIALAPTRKLKSVSGVFIAISSTGCTDVS
jgi:hypothetical protein